MNWTAIVVETSTEAVDAVSYILTDTGATGVKIDDAADYRNCRPEHLTTPRGGGGRDRLLPAHDLRARKNH